MFCQDRQFWAPLPGGIGFFCRYLRPGFRAQQGSPVLEHDLLNNYLHQNHPKMSSRTTKSSKIFRDKCSLKNVSISLVTTSASRVLSHVVRNQASASTQPGRRPKFQHQELGDQRIDGSVVHCFCYLWTEFW
eukprot:s104_g29.t1